MIAARYITCARVIKRANTKHMVKTLEIAFAREGKPRVIVIDNG
ncbi:MAG: hypothetical protein ACFFD4_27135 [Candidatus Odinarchaeota archaeon]